MAALTKLLTQRRQAAIDRAEHVASSFPDHRSAGMEAQLELETALDDVDRYERMLTSVCGAVVRREAGPYQRDGEHSFFADVVRVQRYGAASQRDSADRLQRLTVLNADKARIVEQRDNVTAAMGGTVPPTYLLDQMALAAREASPLVDVLAKLPLSEEGMTVELGRITTGAIADFAIEGSQLPEFDLVSAGLSLPVRGVWAKVTESYAFYERAGRTTDTVIAHDLGEAVGYATENFIINGIGGAKYPIGILQTSGVTPTTYTDGTPTAGELVAKVAACATSVSAARKRRPNLVLMSPRRWFWLTAQVDTALQPIVGLSTEPPDPNSPYVGTISGLPILLSDAIPTTVGAGLDQDQIVLLRTQDMVLALDDRHMEITASLQMNATASVDVWVGRYMVFSAGRWPAGVGVISGTGLNAIAT